MYFKLDHSTTCEIQGSLAVVIYDSHSTIALHVGILKHPFMPHLHFCQLPLPGAGVWLSGTVHLQIPDLSPAALVIPHLTFT